jgi:outer membrane protein assembly factor BamB
MGRQKGVWLRWLLAAALLALLLPSREAEAVIPSAFGPIQALIVILPQLMLALAGLMLAIFKPRTYKLLGAYLWSHKAFTVVLIGGIGFLIWGPSFSSGKVAEEQVGAPWSAFRGGPGRTGAVAGARGPQSQPRILWKLAGDPLGGATAAVDSSPAVVGNRLYFGVGNNSILSGSKGSICCVDADTGALAWRWTGDKELPSTLKAIFSSPVVWVESPEKGAPPAARYLVCGEGYHEDKDGRLICLDLEPVRKSKGKEPPKLLWFLQATDHVEATPCIHEGKVFVGSGDDGYWCVELATGKVLWHIEGTCDSYELTGPKAASLAALEGKTVAVSGAVRRVGHGAKDKDDPGTMKIEVKEFREVTAPVIPLMASGRTLDRTVIGKVAKGGRLDIAFFNPDSESSPVAVTTESKEQRLLFGSGVGGQRVNCVNAETGELIWKVPVPYPAFGAPTVVGGKVLIGVGKGDFVHSAPDPVGLILCLSLQDGAKLWETKIADTILGAITVMEGRAYACARDGNVYAVDLDRGMILSKYATGSPLVSSPVVTNDAIYVGNDGGRLFCFDRKSGALRFTTPVSPGSPIVSSPAVSSGKLFLGTRNKGMLCLADAPADDAAKAALKPWTGPGGDAGRTGCADERGLPQLQPDKDGMVDQRWEPADSLKRPVTGPLSVQGKSVLVSFGAGTFAVDPATGQMEKAQAPSKEEGTARVHGLHFLMDDGAVACRSGDGKALLWRVTPETPATGIPTVAGDRVFLTTAGKDKAKAFIEGRRLVDGALVWRRELDDVPLSYVVASAEWCAVATADEKIALFGASGGKLREPLPVGGKPVAPALCGDVLVIAGENRIAAHDLSASEWIWNYKDQDNIGMVTGPPIVLGETIWVGTTKRGLIAIGIPPTQARK